MKEGESLREDKHLAAQLAEWDNRIVQITAIKEPTDEAPRVELVCSFDPEPACDTIGFFWIANLLTRLEFEEPESAQQPFDLGFRIGEQIFLPNGEIIQVVENHPVVWPEHEQ
jgi:hypothetical protein